MQVIRGMQRVLKSAWAAIRWLWHALWKANDLLGKLLSFMLIPIVCYFSVYEILHLFQEGYKNDIPNPILGTAWNILLTLFLIAGALFPVFILYGEWQKWAFKRWVKKHEGRLLCEDWAAYRGVRVYGVTKVTQFKIVFSVGVYTLQFDSGFYFPDVDRGAAWLIRIFYTLYCFLFGWWNVTGLDGVVNTILAIKRNLAGGDSIMVMDLL